MDSAASQETGSVQWLGTNVSVSLLSLASPSISLKGLKNIFMVWRRQEMLVKCYRVNFQDTFSS